MSKYIVFALTILYETYLKFKTPCLRRDGLGEGLCDAVVVGGAVEAPQRGDARVGERVGAQEPHDGACKNAEGGERETSFRPLRLHETRLWHFEANFQLVFFMSSGMGSKVGPRLHGSCILAPSMAARC